MKQSFDTFWMVYPRKIAKGSARNAFERALKKTTLEIMLNAIENYKRHKPDDIDYCHPATWLNGERWDDQWQDEATIKPEPLFRPACTPDEVRAFYASIGKPLTPEILRARTVDELPVFARMVPRDWNVTPMKRA